MNPIEGFAQNLKLEIAGDETSGYHVDIYAGDEPIVTNQGEFSISLSNLDSSVKNDIRDWKASSYTQEESRIVLTKDTYIPEFDANLIINVIYEIINPALIKKTVRLYQTAMPTLYYNMDITAIPAAPPSEYVTFEHSDFPGGFVHELYPSAGFITQNGHVAGFLTNPGYRNHFTRTTRRRFTDGGGGMIGMRVLPDVDLVSVATKEQQDEGEHFIRYSFGNSWNLDRGDLKELILPDHYAQEGDVQVDREDGLIEMIFASSGMEGIHTMVPLEDQKVYTISFKAKGDSPFMLKLHRMKNGKKGQELEHGIKYIDNFPVDQNFWREFKGSVMIPYIENDKVTMFLGKSGEGKTALAIKDLKIVEHTPFKQSYNRLPFGETIEKVSYVFYEAWASQNKFKISSQIRLAEGMGFRGSEIEKMLYGNFQMMTWITSVDDFTPFNVPNLNYSPDMYNRDSFWSVISTYNKDLNIQIWNQWARTQTPRGAIGTIITPYMGSSEAKDNEATIEWLIWALLNKRRFGVELPEEKIALAANYILDEFDADRNGICASHFSMTQIDVMDYHPKTERMAANQGMFVIALKTIQALGLELDDEYVNTAEKEYLNFYDRERKHLLFDRDYPDLISLTDLIPEFLSLWLFDRPMLSDEMVINHLEQIPALNKVDHSPYPEIGTTAPIIVRLTHDEKGYSYMDSEYQPFGQFGQDNYADHARDGFYYNGGSWLRAEYSAYVVGLRHGWDKAEKRMENRLWAEMNLNPNWPYSKEFIPTKWESHDQWWPSTRGLSWNVFVLMANEVAGIRSPEGDPDYLQ